MADDIADIISSLKPEDISSLKQMAENLFKENPALRSVVDGAAADEPQGGPKITAEEDGGGIGLNPELLKKLSGIMSKSGGNDKRSALLLSLKPHLSPERQKRTDNAIQILRLIKVLPMLGLFDKRD